MAERTWGYGYTLECEEGYGAFATPEQAIQAAAEDLLAHPDLEPDTPVYLYRGRPPTHPADAVSDTRIEQLLEIEEWQEHEDYELECCSSWPDLDREHEQSFVASVRAAIRSWFDEHPEAMPHWWVYDGETRAVRADRMASALAAAQGPDTEGGGDAD